MVGDTNTSIFYYAPAILLFPISLTKWSIKNFSNLFQNFYFTGPSTKKIEFDYVFFPASILSEDGVRRKFLKIGSNSMFLK